MAIFMKFGDKAKGDVPKASDFLLTRSATISEVPNEASNDEARLERTCRLFYGRAPSAREREVNRRFLDETLRETKGGDATRNAWAAWLRVMFASNEFVYVD